MNTLEHTTPDGEKRALADVPSIAKLRNLLRSEPDVWAQHDERNRWFCPHCGEILSRIVIPADSFLLLQDCPHLIREHLLACHAVQNGLAADKQLVVKASRSNELKSVMHKARMNQRQLLKPVPALPGYEIGCLYRPMDALAGDFYDFITLPGDKLGLTVGDPSGHGVEACMAMAVTKKLISMYGRSGLTPSDCLTAVNAEIYDDIADGAFISALYGVLDVAGRTFTFSRAGHHPPIIYNPAREPKVQILKSNGIALGVDPGRNFTKQIEQTTIELQDNDILLLYTDGMTEINDAKGDELGAEGFAAIVAKFAERRMEDMVNQIWYSLEKLFRSTGQLDDMTMLVLRVLPR